jgi:hypothetical protein
MQLPAILNDDQIGNLAREISSFHRECSQIAGSLPATSNSVKGDAIHLLDQLSHEFAAEHFGLRHDDIEIAKRSTHQFISPSILTPMTMIWSSAGAAVIQPLSTSTFWMLFFKS